MRLTKKKTQYTKNLWDAAKASLRGKFIKVNTYIEKQKGPQINKLTLYFKEIGKKYTKLTVSTRKKIIKIKAEINEIKTRKINKTELLF